ncbi:MAG TPA: hypothetical protein PKB14_24755 [Rubrivivax sp.]|nr:hypothetical protein [Rubrivivax sp.]
MVVTCSPSSRKACIPVVLLAAAIAQSAEAQPQAAGFLDFGLDLDLDVSVGYLYDDNVTRAPSGPDKLSDQFYSLHASKTFTFAVSEHARFAVEAFAGGELAQRYDGLGNVFGGTQIALQYRGSTEFGAPTFSVFGRVLGENFDSELRSGYRFAAGASVRQPVTQELNLFAAYTYNWRNANSEVFDTRDNSVLGSLDYSFGRFGTLTFSAEYQWGTIVSTGQPTLTILDIAQVFVADDVFTSPQMINYRFKADSVLTTLNYNVPISQAAALDFSWRRVGSKSTLSATFPGGGPLRYVDNQFNLQLLVRF